MWPSATLRPGAAAIPALVLALTLALGAAVRAADYDYEDEDNGPDGRRSTWELNTSLTFDRYLEPFPRVDSARACRNRCVRDRRCTGWTYYDASFRDAGAASYKLQRVCVLGAGLRDKQAGNRSGRTSGIVRSVGHSGDDRY